MQTTQAKSEACRICGQQKDPSEMIPGGAVRPAIAELIRAKYPDWSQDCYICRRDLGEFMAEYVTRTLEAEKGQVSELESQVVEAMRKQELLSKNLNTEYDSRLSFGQRVADKVAEFGGSWKFIISFGIILVLWIVLNSIALLRKPFDPYPYILLNLVLSSLAAFQAPVIMMSQNRQESKDRLRSENDYQVNLKAELEIRNLTEKMDHLLHDQWQRLLEIQQIQTDLMQQLINGAPAEKGD